VLNRPWEIARYVVQPWPYDWRVRLEHAVQQLMVSSPREVGERTVPPYRTPPSLSQILEAARGELQFLTDKIALACHSTGGLIVRAALLQSGVEQYVDQAFFINVPFWGAPKTYYVYVTGDMVLNVAWPLMQELNPNSPIIYYLSPSERYPDPVVQEDWAARAQLGIATRRRAGHPATAIMNPIIDAHNAAARDAERRAEAPLGHLGEPLAAPTPVEPQLPHFNPVIERAAAAFHASIAGEPRIGWANCTVFWNENGTPSTPGPVWLDGRGHGHFEPTDGDGTVPSVSQRADAPRASQVLNPDPVVGHVEAPNQPFVWRHVITRLILPGPRRHRGRT
jgi:hypothetical protein